MFTNANVLDIRQGQIRPDHTVVVAGGRILYVGTDKPDGHTDARTIDVRGRTLMPGLIDAHVHVTQVSADFHELRSWSPFYVAARTARLLREMLLRGFTTVRDMGGADWGLAQAVREGLIEGPRLLFGGPIHAPTGGHALTKICDGPVEVRRAIREQMARGAHHVKLTLSGGVVSAQAIDALGYSTEEIRAAVDEAALAHRYVAGHAYTAEAVNRALECGVRTIEHGNLIDQSSIDLLVKHDAYLVPTLATLDALARDGASHLDDERCCKLHTVNSGGLDALELADSADVKIGYGTDLHGAHHDDQLREFTLRAQVQEPVDIIRSATLIGAEIAGIDGVTGEITENSVADLLVVDGNPLDDLTVLTEPERYLRLVMHDGKLAKNDLP